LARQRLIKPDFFQHEELYRAEQVSALPLRVAYPGLWTCCDRRGCFEWKPSKLKLNILPFDDVDFAAVLDALEAGGFVRSYVVDGQRFGVVDSLPKHQTFHPKEKPNPLIPDPPPAALAQDQPAASSGPTLGKQGVSPSVVSTVTVTGTVAVTGAAGSLPAQGRNTASHGQAMGEHTADTDTSRDRFLDSLPDDLARKKWAGQLLAWEQGMHGEAFTAAAIDRGLGDYLLNTREPDFNTQHIRRYIERAQRGLARATELLQVPVTDDVRERAEWLRREVFSSGIHTWYQHQFEDLFAQSREQMADPDRLRREWALYGREIKRILDRHPKEGEFLPALIKLMAQRPSGDSREVA
jgi:hypothetical protein